MSQAIQVTNWVVPTVQTVHILAILVRRPRLIHSMYLLSLIINASYLRG
jgi:hypothetical protein